MKNNNTKNRVPKLGDFYWAYADILRGIGIPSTTYDQRILAFMSIKLLIDNDKLLFNFDYKNKFGLNSKQYEKFKGKSTKDTFFKIVNNLDKLGCNLNYFEQDSKYNPGINRNILSYINNPSFFDLNSYINELSNDYLEMVLDIYSDNAYFRNYPKEKYKDLYELTISRMKKLSGDLTGQHFTQKSIIHLMCEVALKSIKNNDLIAIYDPACGTGSMIMESAHYFHKKNKSVKIEVYGQEYHGQTWLLSKIFLEITSLDGKKQGIPNIIAFGNTLINPAFVNSINGKDSFDFIIANPPFGVDWKHDYDAVLDNMKLKDSNFYVIKEKEKVITPKKSDGQFLFMLQIINLMLQEKSRGKRAIASIISSSTLLSNGSLNSSENKIRKQLLSLGLIKTILEQPRGMFTNTDISSHIWFFDTELSSSIKIIKTDNEEEPLFSGHPDSRDKMKNSYSYENIKRIIQLINSSKEYDFLTKNISIKDLSEINISNEIGKKDIFIDTDLDNLERNINKMLKLLTYNEFDL